MLRQQSIGFQKSITTDATGSYLLEVPVGTYELVISGGTQDFSLNIPREYLLRGGTISLTESRVLDITLPVKKVIVHVQDALANPVSGVRVDVPFDTVNNQGLNLGGGVTSLSALNGYSPGPTTDASGNVTLWLFPNSTGYTYTFVATPPSESIYKTFTLSNVFIISDQTEVISLQFINNPPMANAGGPYSVTEGGSMTLSGSGSDLDGDPVDYAWDLDNNGTFETLGQNVTFSAAGRDGPSAQAVVLRACDNKGACGTSNTNVDITNVAPTVGAITAPLDPILVNTGINTSVGFTDPGVSDTHVALWNWGDGSTSGGSVDQVNDTVTGSHAYTTPGVYEVKVTVTDDDLDSGLSVYQFIVVYDSSASGGFVTGAGAFDSPSGAYTSDSTLTGIARFGFVSKYQPGANIPIGNTQFRFQTAQFTFKSIDYQWLVVSGAQAKFKGVGTVNDGGDYGFQLSATDGEVSGGGGIDKFRIKIWDKSNNDTVVYDNMLGAGDGVEPTTIITLGNIIIH